MPGVVVRDVLGHSVAVTTKFTEFAAGRTDRPRTPGGDLVGSDHRAALRSVADAATRAWRAADLGRSCHLPFGLFGAPEAAAINAFDVLGHTWDVAEATGQRVECPDELWMVGLDAARLAIGPDRDHTHYAAEVHTAGDATPNGAVPRVPRAPADAALATPDRASPTVRCMTTRNVMITGAGSGFGKGAALALAARGHAVIATTETEEQAAALRAEAPELTVEKLDITSDDVARPRPGTSTC